MKVSSLKTKRLDKPFIDDGKIHITFTRTAHKITGINLRNKDKTMNIKIIKDDILTAFKKAEKFFAKI